MSEIKMATLFVFLFFAVLQARGSGEQCIEGKYHKTAPSAETQQYHHCQPWKKLTCCKAEFTKELAINETRNLYNHSWHRCGQLSPACLSFWFEQVRSCLSKFSCRLTFEHGRNPIKCQYYTVPYFSNGVCVLGGGEGDPTEVDILYPKKVPT